jgi:hypothetical protein
MMIGVDYDPSDQYPREGMLLGIVILNQCSIDHCHFRPTPATISPPCNDLSKLVHTFRVLCAGLR